MASWDTGDGDDRAKGEIREVTTAQATALLDGAWPSRKLSDAAVERRLAQMRDGTWDPAEYVVAIDPDGRLVGGQAQLAALVQYGQPVSVSFVTVGPVTGVPGLGPKPPEKGDEPSPE